jgi:hypothetical protein
MNKTYFWIVILLTLALPGASTALAKLLFASPL